MELDRNLLEESLQLLGALLDAGAAEPVHLVVSGGSALLAAGIVVRTTRDLAVPATRGVIDGDISPAYPLPDYLIKAAEKVASEFKLRADWLNDATSFLMIALERLPAEFWSDRVEKEYGSRFRVTFIGRLGQIYLKFYAVCGRDERRDLDDLRALCPTREEAARVLRWINAEELLQQARRAALDAALTELGYDELL